MIVLRFFPLVSFLSIGPGKLRPGRTMSSSLYLCGYIPVMEVLSLCGRNSEVHAPSLDQLLRLKT